MVSLTSPLPYFLIMLLLALLAMALVTVIPFCRKIAAPNATRFASIDGLRGFLALGVFFHHAVLTHVYFTTGTWELPYSPLYNLLGNAAVYLFFMITGFLFWSKALTAEGKISPRRHYINRIRRLYPVYLLFLFSFLLVAAAAESFTFRDSALHITAAITRWLFSGLLGFPNIAQIHLASVGAGVSWTLQYEWWFYLLLPWLAGWPVNLVRPERFLIAVIALLIFYAIRHNPRDLAHIANFVLGMVAAYLVRRYPDFPLAQRWWFGLIPAACLLTTLVAYEYLDVPGSLSLRLLLFIALLSFLYGNTLFGLLNTRWARLLGAISYSIYLLHGIVLFLAASAIQHYFRPIAKIDSLHYWLWMAPVAVTVVLIASVTYRYFEHPFIHSSKRATIPPPQSSEISSHAESRTKISVP